MVEMTQDEDGFDIESCDCPHGKMIQSMGVILVKQLTCHNVGMMVTELSRMDIDEENEAEHKDRIAGVLASMAMLSLALAHYAGTERVDELIETRTEILLEEQALLDDKREATSN